MIENGNPGQWCRETNCFTLQGADVGLKLAVKGLFMSWSRFKDWVYILSADMMQRITFD